MPDDAKRPHCSIVWLPSSLPTDRPSSPRPTNQEISTWRPRLPRPIRSGLFFGAVKIGKRYVSFHLMPVYVHPELLDGISPELRQRMQGKSCFNFTRPDDALFAELGSLTGAGYNAYLS